MDEQEDQAYDQPDYGEGVEDALEEEAHWFRVPRESAGPSTPHLIPSGLRCSGREYSRSEGYSKLTVCNESHRARLDWTAEGSCPHTIQHASLSISGLCRWFRFALNVLNFFNLYFGDAVTFHLFDGIAVAFVFEGFVQVRDAL